jgi:hypothetical protein
VSLKFGPFLTNAAAHWLDQKLIGFLLMRKLRPYRDAGPLPIRAKDERAIIDRLRKKQHTQLKHVDDGSAGPTIMIRCQRRFGPCSQS